MSRNRRLGLVALVVVVAVGGFVIANPGGDGTKKASGTAAAPVQKVQIKSGKPVGGVRGLKFTKGDDARIQVSVDKPHLLHLHGYDIEIKVEPGKTTDMAFTARATGRFPIEEHKSDARGGHSHGEAPLARIEVYPR